MKTPSTNAMTRRLAAALASAGFLGACLGLVWLAAQAARAPAATALRDQSREKALAETRSASTRALEACEWQNREKGFIRIPVERAMELTALEWRDPAAGRSNLIGRAAEALAAPPPPPAQTNGD